MTIVIDTHRLLLRKFTNKDAVLIYELNQDPEVTRFTHDPIESLEQAATVLAQNILPQYDLYNYGRWAVHLKSTAESIGWCGLKYRPELKEVDLGYRFKKNSWGHGYATEAADASIRYGLEKLRISRITGRAETGNLGSIRVLEKCGMIYIGNEKIDGYPVRVYAITQQVGG